jgi:hypothetical protein
MPDNPAELPGGFLGRTLRADDTPPDRRSKAAAALVRRRWSQTPHADRAAATQKARDALRQKYLDAVPESVTDPAHAGPPVNVAGTAPAAHLLHERQAPTSTPETKI